MKSCQMNTRSGDERSQAAAENLFSPGYIGGFSAIKHWDLSEQIFESTVYLTTKSVTKRKPIFGSIKFKLKTIKPYKLL